jgi:hypothetical protein
MPTLAQKPMEGQWTDGESMYVGSRLNDTILQFDGWSAHEGGYRFCAIRRAEGKYIIVGVDTSQEYASLSPSLGHVGDNLIFKEIGGISVLITRDKNGKRSGFLQHVPKNIDLADLQATNQTNFGLSGEYVDKASGQKITFSPDTWSVSGCSLGTHYHFETSFDYLTRVMTFDNKRSYEYVKTEDGIDIFAAHTSDGDEDIWVRGKRIQSLRKTGWFNLSRNPDLPGRYAFASTCLLTPGILHHYNAAERRLMRNEIFARHGYKFKTEDMKAYFAAQPWYKPLSEDVVLTDLERFNVEVLEEGK